MTEIRNIIIAFVLGIIFHWFMSLESFNPFSGLSHYFEKSRETLIKERDDYYEKLQGSLQELETSRELYQEEIDWQQQTNYEYMMGDSTFINFIDSVKQSRK